MKTDLRKWLAFGTGIGVEIRATELQVTIARVRPSQVQILGSATVTEFNSRPAAEWGSELSSFLKELGCTHLPVTVLLPRRDVIVRQIHLPGVSNKDMDSAIRLQLDALHPFGEDDVYYSWARIGKGGAVLVGVARREPVDHYSTLFIEAGLKIASFTFSAAAIYSALRVLSRPSGEGFIAFHEAGAETEVYGESEARPIFSAAFGGPSQRAIALAASELRLEPGVQPAAVSDILPKPAVFPESYDPESSNFEKNALGYAAALIAACPWLSLKANLLPLEQRRAASRLRLVPTFALSAVLGVLVIALALFTQYADSRYLGLIEIEIRRQEPQARRLETIDRSIAEIRARTQQLDDFRRRSKTDMDALAEVTKLIAPPGWVTALDMDRTTLQIQGEAEQAAVLLKALDGSAYFERSEFTMPIAPMGVGEGFRIRAARETPVGAAQ
jgi:hypothetical protein